MAGISLLLLRAVLGLAVVTEGAFYVIGPNSTAAAWLAGLLAISMGILLIIGFLTPIACMLAGLAGIGLALSLLPAPASNLWNSKIAVIFGLAILEAILGLGPGAFSVDARVFGRREIIIPSAADLQQDQS